MDVIDRQAAINAVAELIVPLEEYRDFNSGIGSAIKMLTEMPSAEPDVPDTNVGDMISRQAAVDAVIKRDANCGIDSAEVLKALPSAEPEQQWIPSGEKPPGKGNYLVWMPFALPERRIMVAEYCGGYWNIKTPISAWMPLPEPYKEEQR